MIINEDDRIFDMRFPVVVIGGGGCGLCAALAARDAGAEVLVIERDAVPAGSTGMSTGLIPAAGTPEQAAAGIVDGLEDRYPPAQRSDRYALLHPRKS